MKYLLYLAVATILFSSCAKDAKLETVRSGAEDRAYTISVLQKIADPVLVALSEERLHEVLPRREWETRENNIHTSNLQAFGRTLSGMAPWLLLGTDDTEEGQLRAHYIDLSVKCIVNATNPESPDFMFATHTQERIVHVCYLAYPLMLATDVLWNPLSELEKQRVITALKTHRQFKPNESNWLLFSSIIECALWKLTGECELAPIEYAINKHLDWYVGDGTYGDGAEFHWDYYNSYVIQPLLLESVKTCHDMGHPLGNKLDLLIKRGQRYAEVLEHQISPEGTFPVIGRSAIYRFAVFQHIGYMGFRFGWPQSLHPSATRAAITTVIHRMADAPGTFDEQGWLNAGVVGKQLEARDYYNYTGALYFTTLGLMHLGLPANAPFWTDPAEKWYQQRVWSGEYITNQKPLKEKR